MRRVEPDEQWTRNVSEEADKWRNKAMNCKDPEHNPPGMISLPDGTYEHECPSCGNLARVVVNNPKL